MIKYKIQTVNPKYLHHTHLFALKSRGTYFGIHRDCVLKNLDPQCSKTSLILFIENSHAINFKKHLDYQQRDKKVMVNRIIQQHAEVPTTRSTSIQPLDVEKISSRELRMMCLLHFFNLLIISNLKKDNDDVILYGYEFITYEFPNRQIIEHNLYKAFQDAH